ncbi:IclR family transcriptional regulator domain-containing protein [Lichenicoccus roseus]|uniref:IclR family transcriptional regulator n=1 Tax=Lichenicoccus roseus TaxID=2683649 RepID=A0A5R9J2E3_9PROT|nr:IclR family transcriptional regulator C-terminal domain-containing protein [Lichenicoccus roseus]TLU71805.1 IclR family transcriptional regulator [Lichenicoccus roseus]
MDKQAEDRRDFVEALARGLDILVVCANAPNGIRLADVARQTGTTRASARRSLLTLAAKGFLVADEGGFRLTPKVLTLAAPLLSAPLPRLAQPILDQLSARFGESFSLAALAGQDIVYLARSEARRIIALDLTVGSRLPAWCTSMGRVLIAGLPPHEREALLPDTLVLRTPRTITDRRSLLAVLEQVGRDGYCLLDEELEQGLRSLAVPVRHPDGRVAAALNVSTQTARTDRDTLLQQVLPALDEAARSIAPAIPGQRS